jgi:hypothetical protein
MKVILDDFNLMAYFTKYNNDYFGGVLPYPEFKIRKSYFTLGYFSCNYDENYNLYNCVLEISNRYDYTEEQLRDIIVHEMIHYYLAYTGIDVKMNHGKEFNKMARELNENFGLHITPTINTESFKKKSSFSLGYLGSLILE